MVMSMHSSAARRGLRVHRPILKKNDLATPGATALAAMTFQVTSEVGIVWAVFVLMVGLALWFGGDIRHATLGAKFPGWYPPPIVFGVVWSSLFLVFAMLLAQDTTTSAQRYAGLAYYALVLAWTPIFVYSRSYAAGFWYILFTLALTAGYTGWTRSWYMAPQMTWITIATALAASMYALNGPSARVNAGAALAAPA